MAKAEKQATTKSWEQRQAEMDKLIEKWRANAQNPELIEKAAELHRRVCSVKPEDWLRKFDI